MPYAITYPGTLRMYRTKKEAIKMAEDLVHHQIDKTGSAREVEIYKTQLVLTIDPPDPEPKPGKGHPIEETGT